MFAAFDIGGTHTRIGISKDGKTLRDIRLIPTPAHALEGVRLLARTARACAAGARFRGTVIGIAGMFDRTRVKLLFAPHLRGWVGRDLAKLFARALGGRVMCENDAALAGLAEATVGAGKGKRIVAYFTVSTGIGGARIVDGAIDECVFGFEPGHQVIDRRGKTLESLASGSALTRRFGREPKAIQSRFVWNELARFLAYGIHNSMVLWSPDIVVVGGPMVLGRPAISLTAVRANLRRLAQVPSLMPPLARAALGDERGLVGALVYLRAKGHSHGAHRLVY